MTPEEQAFFDEQMVESLKYEAALMKRALRTATVPETPEMAELRMAHQQLSNALQGGMANKLAPRDL